MHYPIGHSDGIMGYTISPDEGRLNILWEYDDELSRSSNMLVRAENHLHSSGRIEKREKKDLVFKSSFDRSSQYYLQLREKYQPPQYDVAFRDKGSVTIQIEDEEFTVSPGEATQEKLPSRMVKTTKRGTKTSLEVAPMVWVANHGKLGFYRAHGGDE